MAIDLSKLKALALPSKEIEAEVLGEKQKVTITAYGDDVSLRMADIMDNYPSEGELRVRLLLLQECAGMSEEDARLYLAKDGKGAAGVLRAIFDLTAEFDKSRLSARDAAKKKSAPGV